jgi:hypothetical protein
MEPSLTVVELIHYAAKLVATDMIVRPIKSGDGIWKWDKILDVTFKDFLSYDLAFWSNVYIIAVDQLRGRETWDSSGYGVVKAYAERMKWSISRRKLREGGVDVSLLEIMI